MANVPPIGRYGELFMSVEEGLGPLIDPTIIVGPKITRLVDDRPRGFVG
jgi:hypothetical protein